LDFPAFFVLRETSLDFFFADFGFGVGVWSRFEFEEAAGSGVSRGVGLGVAPCSSSDFGFALRIGVGDFFSEGSVFSCDSSFANFAWGIAVGAFSAVSEAWCFFADLSLDAFATGLGDFFGFGDGEECASLCSDSSCRLFSSASTCAQRSLPRITPETNAVVSQRRKGTTATERNRAREAINQIVKKVTKLQGQRAVPF
jgi:hypothetical protein